MESNNKTKNGIKEWNNHSRAGSPWHYLTGLCDTYLGSSIVWALTSVYISMPIPTICKECFSHCHSHQECLKQQEFNVIVENANAMAKLRKHIKNTVSEFKGKTAWLKDRDYLIHYQEVLIKNVYDKMDPQRFMTFTFDPKKFSANELSQPILLDNYIKNCIYNLRYLFKDKTMILVREFHKSGIPHYHMAYQCPTPLEHATLMLRMRYYLSKDLRNKRSVHDRTANQYAINYISKSTQNCWIFYGAPLNKENKSLEVQL